MNNAFTEALTQWKKILGDDCITDVSLYPSFISSATFAYDSTPSAIIRPDCIDKLRICIDIANQYKISLYPISTGKNVGYGSGLSIQPRSVIVLLDKMSAILSFNPDLGIISLQPGVTQRQLAEYLSNIKSPYYLGVTGSTPDSSIIGNMLERGEDTIYGDRYQYIISMQVLLMTGEIIDTGFERFSHDSNFINTYSPGIGPSIESLFIQSNLGIVTKIDLQLRKMTGIMKFINIKINNADIDRMLSGIKSLQENWILSTPIIMINANRVNAQLSKKAYINNEWLIGLTLFGANEEILAHQMNYINDHLKLNNQYTCLTYSAETINAYRYNPILPVIKNDTTYINFIAHQLDIPMDDSFKILYRNKKIPQKGVYQPEADDCGAIFVSVISPNLSKYIINAITIINEILNKYNIEPLISIDIISASTVIFHVMMLYDRDIAGSDINASTCYYELLNKLHSSGYFSKRLGINSMNSMPDESPEYSNFIKKIKKICDPNNLLSGGRYDFTRQPGEKDAN